jgi:iron(II)-dependent oxidoreductase
MATMLRFLGSSEHGGFFANTDWVPRVPVLQQKQVFASFFPHGGGSGGGGEGDAVWTFINRDRVNDATGPQIELSSATEEQSTEAFRYYDCYHGQPLEPTASLGPPATLSFTIEAGGIGCLLRLGKQSTTINQTALDAFLGTMARLSAGKPLRSYSRAWHALPQTLLPHNKTTMVTAAAAAAGSAASGTAETVPAGSASSARAVPVPAGMVLVPPGTFDFLLKGVGHEGSAQVQFPWESSPGCTHERVMGVTGAYGQGLYVDQFPVTCSQYAAYLQESTYLPSDPYNWLKNWDHSSAFTDPTRHELPLLPVPRRVGPAETEEDVTVEDSTSWRQPSGPTTAVAAAPVPAAGYEKKPVTYVSYSEAERYCR